jgi:orotidine-5'-phosphate decarboxylase
VNPSGAAYADQKRVTSPSEAVRRGADFVVVGRAILDSPDPGRAARAVVEEMENGRISQAG